MAKTTTYPHQDLIAKNAIDITTLPAKTQKAIAKFAAETDEDLKESLDETIFGQIEDHFTKLKADEEAVKAKTATPAAGTKKVDVSTAASTKSPEQEAAEKAAAAATAPKSGGLMSKIYPGRK